MPARRQEGLPADRRACLDGRREVMREEGGVEESRSRGTVFKTKKIQGYLLTLTFERKMFF